MYLLSLDLVPTQAEAHRIWLHCSSLFPLPAIASRWSRATMTPFIPPWKAQRVAMDNLSQEPSFLQAWKGPHPSWSHSSTVLTWECFQRVIKNSVKKLLMTPKLVFPLPGTRCESAQMWNNTFRMSKPKFLLRRHVTDGPQKEKPFWGRKHYLSADTFKYQIKERGVTQGKMIKKNFRGTDAVNRQQRIKGTRNWFRTFTSIAFQWSIFPTFWDSNKLKAAMLLIKAEILTIL